MDTMKCSGCDVLKPLSEFERKTQLGIKLRKKCTACRETDKRYYLANKEKILASSSAYQKANRKQKNKYGTEYIAKIRAIIREKLGGKCKRCGFSDPRALQIDHVNSDGYKELRKGGPDSYTYLKGVLADTEGRYQLLCANCNWIKRHEENEHPHRIREKHKALESEL